MSDAIVTSGNCQEDTRPASGSRPTVLDAKALAALAQLDPTGNNRLVPRVLATYRTSLARLRTEIARGRTGGDPGAIRLAVHTLKSSSASVGALALSGHCAAAELAVREGRLDALPPMLDELEAEAVRVDVAVLQLLSDPPNAPR